MTSIRITRGSPRAKLTLFGLARSAVIALLASFAALSPASAKNVLTYHYDNQRTGWNSRETVLTPDTVANGQNGKSFKLLASVALDEQVDAQPLVVTNQTIEGLGTHNVVYVVTANNTLYALDASTGAILRQRNFGPPVPQLALPGECNNNATSVGITSTPVIDHASRTLYLMAYVYRRNVPNYFLHAVSLSTLKDVTPPVRVAATGRLRDGTEYKFHAAVSRQRAALLLSNGIVYASFASFCDIFANRSRGWVLGWRTNGLTPLPRNELTNKKTRSSHSFFLTSIWMSGYGPAALPSTGDVYFITGNSDYNGRTIDSVFNVAESAVQISPNLATVKSVFTPDNAAQLEKHDDDFGSGGLMLMPRQTGAPSNLAIAAGKDGKMYLLNADDLKNGSAGALGSYDIGPCWCGPSYFVGHDGRARIVASGGHSVTIWKVLAGAHSRLSLLHSTDPVGGNHDSGFFTTVSSNGTETAVIWAVSRPDDSTSHFIRLYAFNQGGATLMSAPAGTWANTGGHNNTVPVVANGKVYVASYKTVSIFGLSSDFPATVHMPPPEAIARVALKTDEREIFGIVKSMDGLTMTVEKRDGSTVTVDANEAARNFKYAPASVGRAVQIRGTIDKSGVLTASVVLHAKQNPAMWQSDR